MGPLMLCSTGSTNSTIKFESIKMSKIGFIGKVVNA